LFRCQLTSSFSNIQLSLLSTDSKIVTLSNAERNSTKNSKRTKKIKSTSVAKMQSNALFILCLVAAAFAPMARAHGVITAVSGANGMEGAGFGMVSSTPRDGTGRNPFQTDSSIIRDREVASGKASACGRTLAGGTNDIADDLRQSEMAGLASIGPDGKVRMTLHQVNADGGGPYACDVDASATGTMFMAMTVETNVPGKNSRSRAKASEFPIVANMPPGMNCSGGADGQTCIVRCRNAANAGPFGGCVAVTQRN